MSIKVLHITNNFPSKYNQIFGIFVKEQIDSLTRIGIENSIIFINSRYKGKIEYLKSIFKIFVHLSNNKYDIIHCHHSFSAVLLIFSLKFFNNKCIVSYQNDPKKEGGQFLFKIIRRLFSKIILKSKFSGLNEEDVEIVPNGVNLDFFKEMDMHSSKKKVLNI